MKKLIIIILSALCVNFAFADTEAEVSTSVNTVTYDNYTDVFKFFQSELEEHGAESLLVVFDIDRTILNTVDCIDPDEEFSSPFVRFMAKVWRCPGKVTSPILPVLIDHLKSKSIPVMALTARGDNLMEPTLAQLSERLWYSEEIPANMSVTFETAPIY